MGIRILIVDPHPFFCDSLAAALDERPHLEVVAVTTDELEAVRLAEEIGPDIVLTEVLLAKGSGLNLLRRLSDGARSLVLTRRHEGDVLLDAIASGALGCLSHDLPLPDLVPFIERAAAGEFVFDPSRLHEALKRASATRHPQGQGAQKLALLTPREREVLQLLARGLDNRAIAGQLHLSAHTARTHVGNILRKLDVHSRADAAWVALREGPGEGDPHVLRIHGPELGT